MKNTIIITGLVCVTLVILMCGCTENKNNGSSNGTSAKTYTWTAKQATEDMPLDLDWNDGFQMLYNTLKDGDTLIIQDTITNISYNSDKDTTTVTFEWTEDNVTNSFNPFFEGNITNSYKPGDEVKISVTIKYVTVTYQGFNFEMEIYAEQWESEEYFVSDLDSGGEGFKPLPQSCIEKT